MKNVLLAALLLLFGASAMAQMPTILTTMEYFWDTDPGVGNGTEIDIADAAIYTGNLTIDPTNLSAGYHWLYIRAQNDEGVWGIPRRVSILVHEIVAAEYFWNEDPGVGNGIPVPFSTTDLSIVEELTLSTAGFAPGPALLGVRWRLKGGSWGPTTYKKLNISTLFTEGEYFWDNDPGVGNATSFVLPPTTDFVDADIEIDNSGLSSGYHNLFIRTRGLNGSFGLTKKQRIFITREISGGEYFWDIDPGVGNGVALGAISSGSTAQVCGDVTTNGLSIGDHVLYVRTVTEDQVWSIPKAAPVTVTFSDITVGCQGDFNLDGFVNSADFVQLLSAFGSEGNCSFDINGDLKVNSGDVVAMLSVFGSACSDA